MTGKPTVSVIVEPSLSAERSVQVAVAAVEQAVAFRGWKMLAEGSKARFAVSARLADGASTKPHTPGVLPSVKDQSYRISTDGAAVSIVADGVLGAVYGLMWIADRIRTQGESADAWLPEDECRAPKFEQRMGWVHLRLAHTDEPPYVDIEASKKRIEAAVTQLDYALAHGQTVVHAMGTQQLVPWGDKKYGVRAEACRELFREFIKEAHARRLGIYAMDDEFLYLPEWLEKTGATLSTDDPKLWEALKLKYRGVLTELPELDGSGTRIGEIIPQGELLTWHVIHTGEDRSIEANYRRFINAMRDVVNGEFGKQYLHRTWTVNTWEQSSVPEIYARTFTDEVPTEGLTLSIKLTAQDYLSGSPDCAVEFVQAGLEWAYEHGARTMLCAQRKPWDEHLASLMEYTTYRLGWNPYQPVKRIVADWMSATVGPQVADRAAEMLLDLDDIHREGFHVHGPAYHTWEPFRHARYGWICKGNPFLDKGYGQHKLLREIYLMAKPELESGLEKMISHTARYDEWVESFRKWLGDLDDPENGRWLDVILTRGQDYLHINLAYVKAFLRYFDYVDNRDEEHRKIAQKAYDELLPELKRFVNRPNAVPNDVNSNVQGIDEFVRFAADGLKDIDAAEKAMSEAPDEEGVIELLREARERYETAAASADSVEVGRWFGSVDGRSILNVAVETGVCTIENLLGDHAQQDEFDFATRDVTKGEYVVKLTMARDRGWAYILQQPSAENGNVLRVMLDDQRSGYGKYEVFFYRVVK